MGLLYQKSIRCSVRRMGDGKCVSESVLLASDAEVTARIAFAEENFRICCAEWESLRTGTLYQQGQISVDGLIGTEAYFGVGRVLTKVFPLPEQTGVRALFAECVKGAIQAESYLFKKRGFADFVAYQANWDRTHPNTCCYYSNLDKVERRWHEYIGDAVREKDLFSRHKNIAVWQKENGELQAVGSFLDSFHELGITVEMDKGGRITCFDADFLRAPGRICFGTAQRVQQFVGQSLEQLTRGFIQQSLGGGSGCAHLLDIGQETFGCLGRVIGV